MTMSEENQSTTKGEIESVAPAELKERIDSGEEVFILDARAKSGYEEWHIDGENVSIVNYPYFDFIEGVPEDAHDELPDDQKITALCAKGGSSEMVANRLEDEGYDVDHLEYGMKGWARIYEYTELESDVNATIAQYRRPSSGCLAYLIVSDGEAAVIDPLRAFTEKYIDDVSALGADLMYALDTHIHADHISGIRDLAAETDATVVLPETAADRGVDYNVPYETVTDGETLTVGDVEIEVIHSPGHTTGMTSYTVGDVLFTGDGLFTESVARPDLEDPEAAKNAARTLYETFQEKILALPDDTFVAPAHFSDSAEPNTDGTYTTTLGELKASMDVLSLDEDEFVEFIVSDMPPRPANYEDIIATNLGQQLPDDEEAFELELGPNNCAASEGALTN
jgi:glyoxylase-like metal-dependent hydrolase (beta-lactamase superfamily II)/rhodanese-related sulfurtransferase